jgi:membrane glycosyltransferase
MAPVLIGLMLCMPIAMLSSRVSGPGSRLFRTPEQTAPPRVLVRAEEFAKAAEEAAMSPLLELVNDRQLLENHLANLPDEKRRNRGQIDPHLAIARAKIEDAETIGEALDYLTARETFAVLNSPTLLRAVYTMPHGNL